MKLNIAPAAKRKLLITTLFMIFLPITVLLLALRKSYSDLTKDWGSWNVTVSGFAAVLTVHGVLAWFLYTVYTEEVCKES
jgi:putative effector of murein hydrolase LrgA (UPF0299 family)